MNNFTFLLMITLLPLFLNAQKAEIDSKELFSHIKVLASDSLEGRKPGTRGDSLAALYIRDCMIRDHLKLFNDNGFQDFELVTDARPGDNNKFFVGKDWKQGVDFTPLSFSSCTKLETEVCFAGYGFDFSTDSLSWNDYYGLETNGKWVMVLCMDPEPENFNSIFASFSSNRTKVVTAKDYGAGGIIFVYGEKLEEKDILPEMTYDKNASDAGIPVIHITRALADEILKPAGTNIHDLEIALNTNFIPHSFDINTKVLAVTDVKLEKTVTHNIIGIVEGNDPVLKNEYIVIGAHCDHLGYGGPGSGSRVPDTTAIHYGADDNASGVASVLELAEKFAADKSSKRSLIFVAFGAEEMGLVGSKFFVQHPPVPKENIVAMFNFDMTGRMKKEDPFLSVGGTGTGAEFDSLLESFIKGKTFKLVKTEDGYGPSDHSSFYAEKIPVLFFTTGAHSDYHTPGDSYDKINPEGQQAATEYACEVILSIANGNSRPVYRVTGTPPQAGHRMRLKVTLGIIPDVGSSDVKGLRVTGVRKGGPAEKGGILSADIIIKINSDEITNIYDYMARLAKLKAGDTISVTVQRGDKTEVLLIQL